VSHDGLVGSNVLSYVVASWHAEPIAMWWSAVALWFVLPIVVGIIVGCLATGSRYAFSYGRSAFPVSFAKTITASCLGALLGSVLAVVAWGDNGNYGLWGSIYRDDFLYFIIGSVLAVSISPAIERRWQAKRSAKAEAVEANVAEVPERTAAQSISDVVSARAKADAAKAEVAEVNRRLRGQQPWPDGFPPPAAKAAEAEAANAAEAEKRLVEEKRLTEEAEAKKLALENKKRSAKAAEAGKRKIFISYRREDDAGQAGRISDLLESEFEIFMDVDAIRFGVDFVEAINEAVAKCDVLIAVIGRDWLDTRDEAGDRRLDNPNDFVRVEVAAALARQIPVIPILVDGAKIPKPAQLPTDLQQLARRNALDLRNAAFRADMGRLVQQLKAEPRRRI
jgi:hypothetical protein